MPPKTIVNKEEVLNAAISLVRDRGIENVNARSLAEVLGCSTKPLFRLYKNMDELKSDLFLCINNYCSNYLLEHSDFEKDHLGIAIKYISFAKNEPNLFKALFMSNSITRTTIENMLIDKTIEKLLNKVAATAQISKQKAQSVYQKMWLLSHGIASIIATNNNSFQIEDTEKILSDAFNGFVMAVKYGG